MKRTILATIMLVALAFSSKAYDFKSEDGLCYNITSSTEPYTVEVTYESDDFSHETYSGLTSVAIPETVERGGKTYSVTSIGKYAFSECIGLKSVTFAENSQLTSIGDDAFYKCSGLTSVIIPNSVKSIGERAFRGCSSLTSITIPNSVTSIGKYAFEGCSGLTKVNAESIEGWLNISFASYYYSNPLYYAHHLYVGNEEVTELVIPNSVKKIGYYAFEGCSGLTSVTIPNSVTSIGISAFRGCSGLTSVTIPNSVTSIGEGAFYGCSGLTSVTIPNSVTSIGNYAFEFCSGLTSVTIPNSVKSIGNGAFGSCGKLPSINVDSDNSKFSSVDGVLFNKDKTTLVCYPAGKIGSSYIIPSSVTSIGEDAFYGCSGLTSVTIPNSVTSIGRYAFFDCSGLTSVNFAENSQLTSIGGDAFEGCRGLTSVTIPNSVTSIGSYAFYRCSGLTSVTIPNSVTSIGVGAFYSQVTIYCQAASKPSGWNSNWNTSSRPVKWGCKIVSLSVNNDSFGTVSGNGWFAQNTSVEISATPNDNYHFVEWSDKNTDNPRTITVVSDTAFVANFAINTYTVELSGDNGSVSGAGTYEHGAEATLIATPNENYHFVGWGDKNTDNPRTITVVSDTAFVANFAIDTYTVTLSGDNGSIEGAGTYNYGAEVTLIATPNDNYHFVGWGDDNNENPRTITIVSDTTLTAVFAIDTFKVTAYTENGTVSGVGAYPYGTSASLTATPAEHYHFAKWNDGNTENPRSIKVTSDTTLIAVFAIDTLKVNTFAENGTVSGAGLYAYGTQTSLSATPAEHYHFAKWSDGNTKNPRSITVTTDMAFTAMFAIDTLKVTASAENGTVLGAGEYTYGTQTSLTATPAEHYHFAKWNDGNTENPRSIKVTSDTTLIAVFAIDTLKVTASAENGTVEGAGKYEYGTEASLTATPAEHYHFAKWSDGNTVNPRSITVTSDMTFTAMFAIDTLKLEVNAENGTVSGAGEYAYGAETSLTATPAEHYHFAKWSDGNTENPRLVTVASDTILTAEFAIDTLKVTITAQNGTVEGAGEYAYGTNITLTATPVENYKFSRWSDGNADNPRTITVTEDITLEAIFEKADAISANAVNAVNIYAHHNTIVVENADADIFVYDATGRLIARRDVACHVSITMPQQGIYIVKVGAEAKRVIVGY